MAAGSAAAAGLGSPSRASIAPSALVSPGITPTTAAALVPMWLQRALANTVRKPGVDDKSGGVLLAVLGGGASAASETAGSSSAAVDDAFAPLPPSLAQPSQHGAPSPPASYAGASGAGAAGASDFAEATRCVVAPYLRRRTDALTFSATRPTRVERLHAVVQSAAVVNMLLAFDTASASRAPLLLHTCKRGDVDRTSAWHYAARSGVLPFIDWLPLADKLYMYNVLTTTSSGLTAVHLAVWNGQPAALALLLAPWPGSTGRNPFSDRIAANTRLRTRPFSELDLAIIRNHTQCARLLVRQHFFTRELRGGRGAEQLLHRLVLLGDGVAVNTLLQEDANRLRITPNLVDITSRIKYLDACTFTFAQAHNPISQYMYE
ncbi:hypothetical protein EON68_03925, partial [archaeon]